MNLSEIKAAVELLSPEDLAELVQFLRHRGNDAWDSEIDADFSLTGRFHSVIEEVKKDIQEGRIQELP